ncbi:hypothetical protein EDD21DRAFT_422980 [Dissophora ornata]|nr:hypothetical protein EDD21DRAFT_422980 [Dissophora ornata]
MSKITVTETLVRRISIRMPKLSAASAVRIPMLPDGSCYNITLFPPIDNFLHVSVKWMFAESSGQSGLAELQLIKIVPLKEESEPSTIGNDISTITANGEAVKVAIAMNKVLYNNNDYRFDILLGDYKQLIKDNLTKDNQSRKGCDSRTEETMKALLKDVHSVDLCFAFEYDKAYPGLEMWAHRVILSRYKKIANMIQKTTEVMSEEINNVKSSTTFLEVGAPHVADSLVIPVANFSFATLCTILRYIYTDFNTVTWEELLMAADFYGVTDLRNCCEGEVILAIDLFNIGSSFHKVKESALDYIVENMESLVLEGKDPFEPYRLHPKCHDLMVEAMRRRATKGLLTLARWG